MATQQATAATHSMACARPGDMPKGRLAPPASNAAAEPARASGSGGRLRISSARPIMVTVQNAPMPK